MMGGLRRRRLQGSGTQDTRELEQGPHEVASPGGLGLPGTRKGVSPSQTTIFVPGSFPSLFQWGGLRVERRTGVTWEVWRAGTSLTVEEGGQRHRGPLGGPGVLPCAGEEGDLAGAKGRRSHLKARMWRLRVLAGRNVG